MGDIIRMPEAAKPIPPKTITGEHAGQRYVIQYDPVFKRWTWIVNFIRTYKFFGDGDTAEAASRQAQRKIHNMNKMIIEIEEKDVS